MDVRPAPSSLVQGDTVHLRILHMNDIHGAVEPVDEVVGGLPRAASILARERCEAPGATLTLNAGDFAEGTVVSYLSQGQVVTEALNAMDFDAVELGNHDFAWGQDGLRGMVERLEAPVLGANVRRVDGDAPKPSALMEGVEAYVMRDIDGVRVAVVGVDTPDMERFLGPEKLHGLKFEDAAATLTRLLPEVRTKGAQTVIVLSHLGFDQDRKLAGAVPGIDVIVGGHSHTELPQGHQEGDTIIVQAGAQARFVGELDLQLSRSGGRVTSYEARLLPVTPEQAEPDPTVAGIVARYLKEVEAASNRPLGSAAETLHYSHKEAAKLCQIHADSLRAASGADFALCSARNLRGEVGPGTVTFKDLFEAFPMTEEDAIVMRATGRMILAEIEDRVGDGGRGLAVPSGFRYTYDPSLPSGRRLVSATLEDGSPLDPERVYSVATTGATARKKTFKGTDQKTVGSSQQIFMDYFSAGSPWRDDADQRVTREPGPSARSLQ